MKKLEETKNEKLNAEDMQILVISLDNTISGIAQSMSQQKPDQRPRLRDAIKVHQNIQDKLQAFLEAKMKEK